MSKVRFILVGGFLGAGKTTTIARLAKAYREQGRKVDVVTNEQATDLVDTHALRSEGFHVGEVAGSCFCCNFNGLAGAVAHLESQQRPDVILAEPVGSCTDIVATVVQPLRRLCQHKFAVAPYGVILKPSHGRKILKSEPQAGFSPKNHGTSCVAGQAICGVTFLSSGHGLAWGCPSRGAQRDPGLGAVGPAA